LLASIAKESLKIVEGWDFQKEELLSAFALDQSENSKANLED